MIDPRFYASLGPRTAAELAVAAGLEQPTRGGDRQIRSVAASRTAGPEDLSFIEKAGEPCAAGLCFAPEGAAGAFGEDAVVIETKFPRAAFARAAASLINSREFDPGQPSIHPDAKIADGAMIGPGCVIGAGASIGAGARIGPNTVIWPGVQIGWKCNVGANVSIRCALLGEGVTLLSGSRIGETGFGLAPTPAGPVMTPHFGRVILQSGVSVGASSTVDRGLFDDTIIGENSHIDNMSHVGHNCRIGSRVVMAAYAGISGTVTIEDDCRLGGRVGIADHIVIGKGATLMAGASVISNVPPGEIYAGYPARPAGPWKRGLAWVARESQKRPVKKA